MTGMILRELTVYAGITGPLGITNGAGVLAGTN